MTAYAGTLHGEAYEYSVDKIFLDETTLIISLVIVLIIGSATTIAFLIKIIKNRKKK